MAELKRKEGSWALGRQRSAGFCEFKADLVYTVSSRISRAV